MDIQECASLFKLTASNNAKVRQFCIKIGAIFLERKCTLGCLLHQSSTFLRTFYFIVCLTTLGIIIIFLIGWSIKLSVQTFQPLTVIYRRENLACNHWGCTSIYLPFSYPFRSLDISSYFSVMVYIQTFSLEQNPRN